MTTQLQPGQVQQRLQPTTSDTINLTELAEYLWNRILVIGLSVLIGGAAAFVIIFFLITPLYSSGVEFYVNNSLFSFGNAAVSIDNGDLTASRSLVETYIVILNSRETLEEVIHHFRFCFA